jgi:hypothetical protein
VVEDAPDRSQELRKLRGKSASAFAALANVSSFSPIK